MNLKLVVMVPEGYSAELIGPPDPKVEVTEVKMVHDQPGYRVRVRELLPWPNSAKT